LYLHHEYQETEYLEYWHYEDPVKENHFIMVPSGLASKQILYQFQRLYPQQGWGAELLSIFLSFFYIKAVSPPVTTIHTTIPDSYTVLIIFLYFSVITQHTST